MTIGAARVPGKPDSATSQFYINVVDNPRLDQAQEDGAGYAVFGRVVQGQSAVQAIRNARCFVHSTYREPSGRKVTPEELITIKSVRRIDAKGKVIELAPPPEAVAEAEEKGSAVEAEIPLEDDDEPGTPVEDAEEEPAAEQDAEEETPDDADQEASPGEDSDDENPDAEEEEEEKEEETPEVNTSGETPQ